METYNNTSWKLGETKTLPKVDSPTLCTHDVFHAYANPNLALLLNPIHADFDNPRMFEVTGEVCVSDWGKVGMFEQTLVCEIPLPEWYCDYELRKKVAVMFAVLCAEQALEYYSQRNPKDNRLHIRATIETAKEYTKTGSKPVHSTVRGAVDAGYYEQEIIAAKVAWAASYAGYCATYAFNGVDGYLAYAGNAADAARYVAPIDFGKLADLAVESVLGGEPCPQ